MDRARRLAAEIRATGFSCRMCGRCCTRGEDDSMLVLASAPEVRAIMAYTGRAWDEIAEPYPEWIPTGDGGEFTLAWCLRRTDEACIFLSEEKKCMIYPARPLICRTYPFALEDGALAVYACPGIGADRACRDAEMIAEECIRRDAAEADDARKTEEIFMTMKLRPGDHAVVDSEGVKRVWVK